MYLALFLTIRWDPKNYITGGSDIFLFSLIPTIQKYSWNPESSENFIQMNKKGFTIGFQGGYGINIKEDWIGSSSECQHFVCLLN